MASVRGHQTTITVDDDIRKHGFCFVDSVTSKNGSRSDPSAVKTILHPMKLDFPENEVTAILGPSGSGKTTLLSVITDNIQMNISAKGFVNLPGESSFIPQSDVLHGFFTCFSYMKHYARLSGATRYHSDTEINARIDTILSQLGLTEQRNTIVGDVFLKGLSGGQKRRLSIALEVLSQPENLFLDEPTSGLDSESALQVMDFLKMYVREAPNRRVIVTIHQPSSFIWSIIDHVILLSKGKLMYNGPRTSIESFFSSSSYPTPIGWNPADHYVTLVNDEFRRSSHLHTKKSNTTSKDQLFSVDEWAKKFQQWQRSTNMEKLAHPNELQRSPSIIAAESADVKPTWRSHSISVSVELTYRYFLNLFFNPGILGTRIAMYTMLALMVGALFWKVGDRYDFESIQNRLTILFYCVSFFIFMSVAVLPFTVMERDIVDKEIHNKYYSPYLYQIAQAVSSIPSCAILALLVTVIVVTMTKFSEPYWYFLNMFLALLVAEALAILVSHIVPHFVIGMALIAGMYGFFMLFMGFMIIPSDFPNWLEWVYKVAFHTYSWRTFVYHEFSNKNFTGSELFQTGEDVLKFYEIEDVDPGNDMLVLVGYTFVIHTLSVAVLFFRYYAFRGRLEQKLERRLSL